IERGVHTLADEGAGALRRGRDRDWLLEQQRQQLRRAVAAGLTATDVELGRIGRIHRANQPTVIARSRRNLDAQAVHRIETVDTLEEWQMLDRDRDAGVSVLIGITEAAAARGRFRLMARQVRCTARRRR